MSRNSHPDIKLPKIIRTDYSTDTPLRQIDNLAVRQDKYYKKPMLKHILYPPLRKNNLQHQQNIMVQSCIQNKKFEDVWDQNNQRKIKGKLTDDKSDPLVSLPFKDPTLKYYEEYKQLERTILRRAFSNNATISKQLLQDSSTIKMLEKTQSLTVLPLCMGIIKSRAQNTVLNLNNYNLGDRYIFALAAGLKNAKMIEKCLLSHNRITDIGLAQLLGSITPEINTLDLSSNKITKPDAKLLQIILNSQFRLENLNFAHNKLQSQYVANLCNNLHLSKHIKTINLNNNQLNSNCLEAICSLIDKSHIEELYIGHNNFNGKSGDKIFNTLSTNKILKVLDYSFNLMGEDPLLGLSCAKAIANCFRTNKHLQHLDLSFNSFNEEASRIISESLDQNKHLYGLHFQGNYGYVNSKGFLIVQQYQPNGHNKQSQLIKSYEIVTIRQHNSFESHNYKHVCWICEGWNQQQFKFTVPNHLQTEKMLVYIHFDFEKYEPRLISLQDRNIKYTTMVPPNKFRYFFTCNQQIYKDSSIHQEMLPIAEDHQYEMDHCPRRFKVQNVSWRIAKPKKLVNQWHELIVKTIPRMTGLITKKEKKPWIFSQSVWAKQWKIEDEELTKKCFEKDWRNSKISNLVKNQTDQDKVKERLYLSYSIIKNLYRQFSSWSPFGDVWAVSSQPFTQFCQQSKIISKDTPLKIIDLTFITTNSMSGNDWKGNNLVPERGLVRFQFMEALVRLAEQKYKKCLLTDNFFDSVNFILKDHVEPLGLIYNSEKWRSQQYFSEECDTLIKKYRPIFAQIYKKNSKLKLKPGQKPFMCLNQFKSILERSNLTSYLNERDIFISFNTAMMTQVDQLESQRFIKMTEIEFIQALARCASLLASQCTLQLQLFPDNLFMKFEWLIHQIKRYLCNEDIKLQFPEGERSIFAPDEE